MSLESPVMRLKRPEPRDSQMPDTTIDVLSQVASAFRLRGSLSASFSNTAPWGVAMPRQDHALLLVVTRGRVHFELNAEPKRVLELAPGDVVLLPHGDAHSLRDDPSTPVRPFSAPGDCGVEDLTHQRGQSEFLVLCCELSGGNA